MKKNSKKTEKTAKYLNWMSKALNRKLFEGRARGFEDCEVDDRYYGPRYTALDIPGELS